VNSGKGKRGKYSHKRHKIQKKEFYRKIQPSLELWRDKPGRRGEIATTEYRACGTTSTKGTTERSDISQKHQPSPRLWLAGRKEFGTQGLRK
jgi:hypothetical protein